jgi:hypothetical protein
MARTAVVCALNGVVMGVDALMMASVWDVDTGAAQPSQTDWSSGG